MTAVVDGHRDTRGPVPPGPRRLLGVGVRDIRTDAAALHWAILDARPGVDVIQVVHAYQPVHGEVFEGWDIVSAAVQVGARERASVAIIGSPFPGDPEQVLLAQSAEAVLLVLGDDQPASPQHRIAAHLQRTARCPVVCVPRGATVLDGKPVTVVTDDLGLTDVTLDFACEYAERHGVTMEIARTWRSLHRDGAAPNPGELADEHAQLDAELTNVRKRFPGVPIASRIELDEGWLDRARAYSSLLVVGRQTALRLGITSPLREPLCPVAFIPDAWHNRLARNAG